MGITLGLMIGGLILLVAGAELLVRGASRLAAALGIAPLVIGLTIVAFGTSTPELAVSMQSALAGQPDLAIGNVVGSNILNVLLILGLSALITPLLVAQQLVRLDVPLMIGASVLVWVLARNGVVTQLEGIGLFGLMLAYIGFLLWQSRRERNAAVKSEYEQEYASHEPKSVRRNLLNICLLYTSRCV